MSTCAAPPRLLGEIGIQRLVGLVVTGRIDVQHALRPNLHAAEKDRHQDGEVGEPETFLQSNHDENSTWVEATPKCIRNHSH